MFLYKCRIEVKLKRNYMSIKVNPYQITPNIGSSGGSSYTSGNPFSSGALSGPSTPASTYGVNTNIGVGQSMNIAAQAGKPSGIGKTLGFA